MRFRCFFCLAVLAAICMPAFSGCTQNTGGARGKLSGKVTLDDKPVTGGTVTFLSEDGTKVERVPIDENGNYSSDNVPMGKLKIGVEPAAKDPMSVLPKGVKPSTPPKDAAKDITPPGGSVPNANPQAQGKGKYMDIPPILRDANTSSLTFDMTKSPDTHDIKLKK